jgi:hypothetical protein
MRSELASVRARALAAVRRLDLHAKAEAAWQHAFEPIELSDNPPVWLQVTPQNVAFAGIGANSTVLWGSLELSGAAQTFVGQPPPAVTAPALPPLGHEVNQPGTFDVILPVKIGYDAIKDKLMQVIATAPPLAGFLLRNVEVYPSAGQLVIGLQITKASDTDANSGRWVYLTGAVQVDQGGHAVHLSDLAVVAGDEGMTDAINQLLAPIRDKASVDYSVAYENLLNAANAKLTRPLKDGFRMEGHLSSAQLEKVYLPADGVVIAMHATGTMKILYGL